MFRTEEHNRKISEAMKGRKKSLEARKNLSFGRKGIKLSEDHRKNISESLKSAYESGKRIPVRVEFSVKKAAKFCRNSLHRCLALSGTEKEGRTFELLGYSPRELVENISRKFKPGMNWDNYGEWHIDHIRPVSKWPKGTSPSEINSLDNLQPLWKMENYTKSSRYES